jgi:methionine-rich copper-binding protein CopC
MRNRAVLVFCVSFLLSCAAVWGHARLVRSNPADKARLAQSPERVELWFNELLDDSFHQISVFAAREVGLKQRTNLAKGKPVVDAKDRTHLTVEVQPLSPGEYYVEYRVLSRDGHTAPGRFSFRVAEPAGNR